LEHVGTAAAQGCAAACVSVLPVRGRRVQFVGVTADTSDSDKGRFEFAKAFYTPTPLDHVSVYCAGWSGDVVAAASFTAAALIGTAPALEA
jgi:hypothetical protein